MSSAPLLGWIAVACSGDPTREKVAAAPDSAIRDDDAGTDALIAPPGAPSSVAASAVPVVYAVTTLAGGGSGAAPSFQYPMGVALDVAGNVYVADSGAHRIRKVTPAGVVTTLAGSTTPGAGDGTGAAADFQYPSGIAIDPTGTVFVGDTSNHSIRRVTPSGVVTTLAGGAFASFADGTGTAARFFSPHGVAIDAGGNVYVADQANHRIRKVTPGGVVTTLAGSGDRDFADGTGAAASFQDPTGVAADAVGNVYVADQVNHRIRKVTPGGVVTTLAGSGASTFGDGTGAAAHFYWPCGVALDVAGNVFVADVGNHRIRKVTPAGVVTTIAGSGTPAFADGTGAAASFDSPFGVAVDTTGNIYVGDSKNHRIRKLTPLDGQLAVTWSAPSAAGSSAIAGYTASASAAGRTTRTCTTSGSTSCTIGGLTRGIAYIVSVTATSAAGPSAPSAPVAATPN